MALFNFGKKKEEEKKTPACACSSGCPTSESEEIEVLVAEVDGKDSVNIIDPS